MILKKLGLDNANDGLMTVLAGVTFFDVIVRFWRPPVWFSDWDYFALGTIAFAVLFSWLVNLKHRKQVELIREHVDEKTLNLLSVWSRSSVFWTCIAVLQGLSLVHRH